MTPETQAARHELATFRRRRTASGRFVTYCAARARHFLSRQVITLFCFVVFTKMTTLDLAIAALAFVILADVAESLVLYRVSKRQPRPGTLPLLLGATALLAALQALSIVNFVVLITSIGGGITRGLTIAVCLAAILDAALHLPLHRTAAIARIGVLLTTLIGLFVNAFMEVPAFGTAQTYRLIFDLLATILLAAILTLILRNVYSSRRRSTARQETALEKAYELATTAAALTASRETSKRLAAIAEGASDSIIVTDRQGSITWVNAAFTEMMGYSYQEVLGQHISMINGPSTDPAAIDTLMTARREATPAQLQIQNEHKDGHSIWIETRLTPIFDAEGQLASMIAVERDIEHIKAREAALAEAGRVKQAFLATVSHELRTPMNGIIGNAEMLKETPLDPEQAAMLRTISDSSEALLTIVNDILDFSALEAGRLTVSPAPFDPAICIGSVVDLLRPVAARKGIACTLTLPPGLPTTLRGDAGRIRQILSNLIGNAIKFTQSGGVHIAASHVLQGEAAVLRVDVRDTGIGIAADRLTHVFESFTQADTGIAGRFGGTGLGLAISRQLAEAMGGALTATSTEGAGSVFTLEISLPIVRAPPPTPDAGHIEAGQPGTPEPSPEPGLLTGWRILVADDNATNRRLLAAMLRDTGATIGFAETGTEAIDLYLESPPDIVLMDMNMPELDGPGATRAIRREETQRGAAAVPIIALTANALAEDRAACAEAGMTGFLQKPVRRKDLIAALMQHGRDPPARRDAGAERSAG